MKKETLVVISLGLLLLMGVSACTPAKVMEKSNNGQKIEAKLLAGTASPYKEFTKAEYDKAKADGKIILLYFYANWCPLCKQEQVQTFAAFNELNNPSIVGFRVNYKDSNTDADEEVLAKEFGITYQHTKVILKNNQRVLKAPDSWDKERYLEELKKVS